VSVQTILSSTQLSVQNLNYPGNAASGISIVTGSHVGPAGLQGAQGAGGAGLNAFTTLSANFIQPAVNATVSANVGTTAWIATGQGVYVQGGGYYQVASVPDLTHVNLTNLGTAGNAAPGATVTSGTNVTVTPSGTPGTSGVNAFTTTTAAFTQPAVSSTVSVTFGNTAWMAQNQYVFVSGGGTYTVASITDATHAVLLSIAATGNVASGTNVPSGSAVSPAGSAGVQGAIGPQGPPGSGVPPESIGAHLEAPTAKTYIADLSASSSYTIIGFYGLMGTGTATVKLQLNGVDITGSTLNLTTTIANVTLSQAVTQGAKIGFVVTAISGTDLAFSIRIQR
jgi:hypothetical protein